MTSDRSPRPTLEGLDRFPELAELPEDLRDVPPAILEGLVELAACLQRHPYLLLYGPAWGLRLGASSNLVAFVRATCSAPGVESEKADLIAMSLTPISL